MPSHSVAVNSMDVLRHGVLLLQDMIAEAVDRCDDAAHCGPDERVSRPAIPWVFLPARLAHFSILLLLLCRLSPRECSA